MPQQSARRAQLSPGNQFPDLAAGNSQSSDLAGGVDYHVKTKRAAQLAQFGGAPFGPVAKTKIGSFMDLDRPQCVTHDGGDKFRGPHAGELSGEAQHQDCIHAGVSQQLQPRLQRSDELGACFRP